MGTLSKLERRIEKVIYTLDGINTDLINFREMLKNRESFKNSTEVELEDIKKIIKIIERDF